MERIETVQLTEKDLNDPASQALVKGLETLGFAVVHAPDVLPLSLIEKSLSRCADLLDNTPRGTNSTSLSVRGALLVGSLLVG